MSSPRLGGPCYLFSPTDSTRSSTRSGNNGDPVTAENAGVRVTTDRKRRFRAESSDGKKTTTSSKRIKTSTSSRGKRSTENTEGSEKEEAGTSGPQELSPKHPVDVQNGIYAAERLSCSLDITHSLNFILRGKTRLSEIFVRCDSLRIWHSREHIAHYVVRQGEHHPIGGLRHP